MVHGQRVITGLKRGVNGGVMASVHLVEMCVYNGTREDKRLSFGGGKQLSVFVIE